MGAFSGGLRALVLCGALFSGLAQAQTPCEEAKLLASDPDDDDRFGQAVALHGDVALVGAFKHDDVGLNSGSAYVFRRSGTNWPEEAELLASDGSSQDRFGWSVAISGDLAVVGAREDDDGGSNSGSAYVFRFNGVAWVEETKLTASDAAADDEFGVSVAIDGDTVVVGANLDDHVAVDAGAAYVFRHNGLAWVEEAKLVASDPEMGDHLGESVGVSGDVAIAGAPLEDQGGGSSGAAYVFRRSGTTWTQGLKLASGDLQGNDRFGHSVAASGDAVLVGAMNSDENGSSSGSAYVFRFDGVNWNEEQELSASDGTFADFFGWSVSIDGDVAAVGAQLEDGTASDSGSAYVYRRDPDTGLWGNEGKVTGSDIAANDFFGFSVSTQGDRVLVGAWGGDVGGGEAGAAYVFAGTRVLDCNANGVADACDILAGSSLDNDGNDIPDECDLAQVAIYCTGKTTSLGCIPFLAFTGIPSTTSSNPFQIVANDLIPNESGFMLYGFKKSNLNFHGGKLCIKAPLTRFLPIKNAGSAGTPPCSGRLTKNFNKRIQAGVDPLLSTGQTVALQFRQRDPALGDGFNDTLTDGLRFQITP